MSKVGLKRHGLQRSTLCGLAAGEFETLDDRHLVGILSGWRDEGDRQRPIRPHLRGAQHPAE